MGWKWIRALAILTAIVLITWIVSSTSLAIGLFAPMRHFLDLPSGEQDRQANVASMFIGTAALILTVLALVVSVLQLRQGRADSSRTQSGPRPGGGISTENRLRRLTDDSAFALALRVHPSIALDIQETAGGGSPAQRSPRARWRPARRSGDSQDSLDPILPTWVERDLAGQVREWMAAAATGNGFLVLVGDSSVGKTRLLYETANDILRGWRVVDPALGDGEAINRLAQDGGGPFHRW